MVEAVRVESVHELGEGPGGAHNGEHGQEHAPPRQWTPEVKCRPEYCYHPLMMSSHVTLVTCWPYRSGLQR